VYYRWNGVGKCRMGAGCHRSVECPLACQVVIETEPVLKSSRMAQNWNWNCLEPANFWFKLAKNQFELL